MNTYALDRKAADQGNANAQINLARMYYSGLGVPKDITKAHMWSNISGAGGNQIGSENIANIEKLMTSVQIAEAQRLAREWTEKHQ